MNQSGKNIEGLLDAESYEAAKDRLVQQKIWITHLSNVEDKKLSLSPSMLLAFTRELSQLTGAGLPLYDSLITIKEKYQKHKIYPLLLDFCESLKGGQSFSSILQKYPHIFDPIYIFTIKSAEKSGGLEQALKELSDLITKQQALKKMLVSTLSYPIVLLGFSFIVIMSLLLFVIPSMSELFEGRDVNKMTAFVLNASHFIINYGWYLLSGTLVLITSVLIMSFQKQYRHLIHKWLVSAPFLKNFFLLSSLIRFSRCCSSLMSQGVSLLDSLHLAKKVMNNMAMESIISQTEEKIIEGRKLSEEWQRFPLIPSMMTRMVKTGEETGDMAKIFKHVADIYSNQLENDLNQLATLLQPILLILLGGIVGLVILSVILPLTDMSSFASY